MLKYFTYLVLNILYIKGSISCLKTTYIKHCLQIINYLTDSPRQGSLQCLEPTEDQSEI